MADVTCIAGAILTSRCVWMSIKVWWCMEVTICIKASYFMSALVLLRRYSVLWPISELNFHVVHNIFMSPMKSRIKWKDRSVNWGTVDLNNTQQHPMQWYLLYWIWKTGKGCWGPWMDQLWGEKADESWDSIEKGINPTRPALDRTGLQWIAMDSARHRPFGSGGVSWKNGRIWWTIDLLLPLQLLHSHCCTEQFKWQRLKSLWWISSI